MGWACGGWDASPSFLCPLLLPCRLHMLMHVTIEDTESLMVLPNPAPSAHRPTSAPKRQHLAMCPPGVESSAPALDLANSNAQLNGWQPSQYTFLKDDIMKYLQQQAAGGALWDLVVLDPPKLAPNRKSLNRALVKYRKLNTLVGAVTHQPLTLQP